MRHLMPSEILDLWERGRSEHPVDRALTLAGVAHPEAARDERAAWPLGRRDAALLELYRDHFSAVVEAIAECPRCGERLEVTLPVADLLAAAEPADPASEPGERQGSVTVGDRAIGFRLPNSFDLAAMAGCRDVSAARDLLLARCVAAEPGSLSAGEVEEVERAIAAADPMAEVLLELSCAECGHGWEEPLDAAAFPWQRIADRAEALLLDIDCLARAYGWTEADVLALSPTRRRWYVEANR